MGVYNCQQGKVTSLKDGFLDLSIHLKVRMLDLAYEELFCDEGCYIDQPQNVENNNYGMLDRHSCSSGSTCLPNHTVQIDSD